MAERWKEGGNPWPKHALTITSDQPPFPNGCKSTCAHIHKHVPHLRRAVAAHGGGAGISAGARDVAVLVVAAGPRRVPSRTVAGWRWWLLWWWLWWWWLLWWWLLLGSPVVAASVVGVVVIPVVVTPAVLVVATTSTSVETCIGEIHNRGLIILNVQPSGIGLPW